MTAVWILLLLQLRLTREEDAYVQKGQDQVFPCGLVKGGEEVTWSYNTGVPESQSVLLFRAVAGQALKKQVARERLSMFPNQSLYLWGAEDRDMGTYWCSVQGVNRHTYQLKVFTVKDPPSCSSAWIPLAVCAALEFLLLLALGAALWWRGRPAQRSHLGDLSAHTQPEPPGPKSQTQLYENVGLGYAAGGADPAQL